MNKKKRYLSFPITEEEERRFTELKKFFNVKNKTDVVRLMLKEKFKREV